MTLFQDTGSDPRGARAPLADVLQWYGAIGDAVLGNPPGFALRKASLAVALAEIAQLSDEERHALAFAGLLHAAGAIGSPAYRKGEHASERVAKMERWDVPARGARFCATIASLPPQTPDMIRWQSECWDGTGYPDQLRWHGIPRAAQLLALADFYLRAPDPEEALGTIGMQSGRAFGPDHTRTFTVWFHRSAGEVEERPLPTDALSLTSAPEDVLATMSDALDAHNGVAGRWRRVDRLCAGASASMKLDEASRARLALACRLFSSGEAAADTVEDEQFDPLARLGLDARATNAGRAAGFLEDLPMLAPAAVIVASRSEWFDGTGKPKRLRHGEFPRESEILAAAIAYDRLDRGERLEDATGTQFDPAVVRAVMETAKAHA